MGSSISTLFNNLWGMYEMRIVMVGLDGAGKTTILYKLKLDDNITTIPTIGFNVETVQYKNINFTVWDVGGQEKIRKLWQNYFENTDAIIFVVDSNDRDRIQEARNELHQMLKNEKLHDSLLVVLANKKDLPNALNTDKLIDELDLHSIIPSGRKWHIQATCATNNEGLYEGLEWLNQNLTSLNLKRSKNFSIPTINLRDKVMDLIYLSKFYMFDHKNVNVLLTGLNCSGKTTILYRLLGKYDEYVKPNPTFGRDIETVKYKEFNFIIHDNSTFSNSRYLLYRHELKKMQAVIFVVDSNNQDNILEARDEFHHLLNYEQNDIPYLIFANKQDLPNALSAYEICEKLKFVSTRDAYKSHEFYLLGVSATVDEDRLYEGLEWIYNILQEKK